MSKHRFIVTLELKEDLSQQQIHELIKKCVFAQVDIEHPILKMEVIPQPVPKEPNKTGKFVIVCTPAGEYGCFRPWLYYSRLPKITTKSQEFLPCGFVLMDKKKVVKYDTREKAEQVATKIHGIKSIPEGYSKPTVQELVEHELPGTT